MDETDIWYVLADNQAPLDVRTPDDFLQCSSKHPSAHCSLLTRYVRPETQICAFQYEFGPNFFCFGKLVGVTCDIHAY